MAYEVLARKWRPQQFADVIGQDHVTRTLTNAIESGRVAHSYLFVGPRGTGKTSTARIFAKALNCQKGPAAKPCDACDSCREIMAGNCMDVMEFDAASNTGVDYIRELREAVGYAPARGPYKIYIIDEVHMLSVNSFNALLKTLEEPPKHVKFLFATTDPQKIPATILSRCQRFDLRRISAQDIVKHLSTIAKAEKVGIDDDALLAIARGAEGGLRDAESALDQLISFRGQAIKEEDVLSVFGLVARKTLESMVEAVLKGDAMGALRMVAELDKSGKDIQRLVHELIEHFRNLLVFAYAGENCQGLDIADAQMAVLKAQSGMSEPSRMLRIVDILSELDGKLRYALSKRTLFELALIRCSRAAVVVSLEQILEQLNALRSGAPAPAAVAESRPVYPERVEMSPAPSARIPVETKPELPPVAPLVEAETESLDPLVRLSRHWHEIVDKVGHMAMLAKGYLIDAKPLRLVGSHLTIGFDPEFAANKDKLNQVPRGARAVQRAVSDVLGREITVDFVVLDAKSTLPGDIKIKDLMDDSGPAMVKESPAHHAQKSAPKTRQEWINNPVVRKTLEMFNGGIVDIRE